MALRVYIDFETGTGYDERGGWTKRQRALFDRLVDMLYDAVRLRIDSGTCRNLSDASADIGLSYIDAIVLYDGGQEVALLVIAVQLEPAQLPIRLLQGVVYSEMDYYDEEQVDTLDVLEERLLDEAMHKQRQGTLGDRSVVSAGAGNAQLDAVVMRYDDEIALWICNAELPPADYRIITKILPGTDYEQCDDWSLAEADNYRRLIGAIHDQAFHLRSRGELEHNSVVSAQVGASEIDALVLCDARRVVMLVYRLRVRPGDNDDDPGGGGGGKPVDLTAGEKLTDAYVHDCGRYIELVQVFGDPIRAPGTINRLAGDADVEPAGQQPSEPRACGEEAGRDYRSDISSVFCSELHGDEVLRISRFLVSLLASVHIARILTCAMIIDLLSRKSHCELFDRLFGENYSSEIEALICALPSPQLQTLELSKSPLFGPVALLHAFVETHTAACTEMKRAASLFPESKRGAEFSAGSSWALMEENAIASAHSRVLVLCLRLPDPVPDPVNDGEMLISRAPGLIEILEALICRPDILVQESGRLGARCHSISKDILFRVDCGSEAESVELPFDEKIGISGNKEDLGQFEMPARWDPGRRADDLDNNDILGDLLFSQFPVQIMHGASSACLDQENARPGKRESLDPPERWIARSQSRTADAAEFVLEQHVGGKRAGADWSTALRRASRPEPPAELLPM